MRVTIIGELATEEAKNSQVSSVRRLLVTASVVPDEGDAKLLRNVGSYNIPTA
jgi:hypothetical protein